MERKKTTGLRGVPKDSPRKKPTLKTKGKMGVPGMGKLMSQGMSATAAQKLFNMIREDKPRGRITQMDIQKYMKRGNTSKNRKNIPTPPTPFAMRKTPNKKK